MLDEGMFVVFEGLDRSGKTTTICKMYERLSLITHTKKICFPVREGEIGKLLDKHLQGKTVKFKDETVHLLFGCDRYEHRSIIEETRKHAVILCDRYSMSGIAYSAAKGLDLEWCITSERLLPKPDLTVFINVPVEELFKRRMELGKEIYDTKEFQERVFLFYEKLIDRENSVLIVNGMLPTDEIVEIVIKEMLNIRKLPSVYNNLF